MSSRAVRVAAAASALVAVLALVSAPARAAGAGGGAAAPAPSTPTRSGAPASSYRPPVDAPVLDPFRAPAGPYGPGNRGIEYATTPGAVLTAIGAGVVSFAGPVAGREVVSVVHPDGLRSSLTGVARPLVAAGAVVAAGAPIALAGPRTHLGVRRDDRYLDPATLWAGGPQRPRRAVLVPALGPRAARG